MQRIRFGRTGLEVSRIGFGSIQIVTKCDYTQAERLLNAALDAGSGSGRTQFTPFVVALAPATTGRSTSR